jgi:hypothetical protein
VDKTTTLNDAQNEKSNSSANEAQKTRPFSFLGLLYCNILAYNYFFEKYA